MAESAMKPINFEGPFLSGESAWIRAHMPALIIATLGAMVAGAAIYAPLTTVLVLGVLLSVAVAPHVRRRAWSLLCFLVIPAIGLGELGRFETNSGTLIAPSLIVVAVWAAGFFITVLSEKDQSLWRLPLVGAFAIYLLSIALSVINSVSVLHWARGLLEASLGYAFFVCPILYLRNRKQLNACLRVLVALAVITVLFGVIQYVAFESVRDLFPLMYADKEIPWIEHWQEAGRMVANWVHPSDFVSLLNIAAPIALYSLLSTRKSRLMPLVTLFIIATGVILGATRTPIVAFCVSATLLCFLMRARRVALMIVAGAAAILLLGFFSNASQRFNFSDEGNLTSFDERKLLWLEATGFFVQHPLVGIGARNFMDQGSFLPGMGTHNVFFETAAETGVIGLFGLFYLLYRSFRADFKNRKTRLPLELQNLRYAFFCSSFAIVVECLTGNDFYVWQVWCLFWLMRGLSAVIAARPESFLAENLKR